MQSALPSKKYGSTPRILCLYNILYHRHTNTNGLKGYRKPLHMRLYAPVSPHTGERSPRDICMPTQSSRMGCNYAELLHYSPIYPGIILWTLISWPVDRDACSHSLGRLDADVPPWMRTACKTACTWLPRSTHFSTCTCQPLSTALKRPRYIA